MTTTYTREQAIEILAATTLGEEIGMGGYSDSAAYKLANGDIDASSAGLDDQTRAAIVAVQQSGGIDFADFGR